MITFICDACGRKVTSPNTMGVYITDIKMMGVPSKAMDALMNGKHVCEDCISRLCGKGLLKDGDEQSATEPIPEDVPAPKNPVTESSDVKNGETGDTESQPAKKGGRAVIDVDKILALRKANWSNTEIASEMGLKPNQVAQALAYTKKNHPEKFRKAELPLN